MATKDDKIKDLFSSKLNNFEPEVPASVWSGIDQLLSDVLTPQAIGVTLPLKAKRAKLRATLVAVGIAASIALGVIFVFQPTELSAPQIVEEVKPQDIIEQPNESVKVIEPKVAIEEPKPVIAQNGVASPTKRSVSQPAIKSVGVSTMSTPIQDTASRDTTINVNNEPTISVVKSDGGKNCTKPTSKGNELKPKEEVFFAHALPKKPRGEDVSLGLKSNAGVLSGGSANNNSGVLFSSADRSEQFTSMLKSEDKEYELDHKQPISVGITVAKGIAPQLSIETGVMFTYLSSKVRSSSMLNIKEDQTFGYLGVPIYLNYNFYELYRAKFYISLGAMAQKDVYGRYTSKLAGAQSSKANGVLLYDAPSEILYAEPSYMKKNISQKHWQFSTHLTVGAAYPIYDKLYVHTSIGGAYYFDAKNEYKTVYSDRKFQLDLNLGLRFDF